MSEKAGGFCLAGTDIFLSYARTDQATARIFAECFGEEGFSVWWDASLHSGQTFDEVIEQNLRDAKAVVVLWSPRSVASRWVRAEATLADRRNKLAPAIIEPCDRPIIFELTHAADLTEWAGDTSDPRWRNFMHDLRRLVEAEEAVVPTPAAPASRPVAPPSPRPAPAANRQPLRPGSGEVIFAGRPQPEPRAQRPHVPASNAPEPSDEVASDVHYLQVEDEELRDEAFLIGPSGAKIGRTEVRRRAGRVMKMSENRVHLAWALRAGTSWALRAGTYGKAAWRPVYGSRICCLLRCRCTRHPKEEV